MRQRRPIVIQEPPAIQVDYQITIIPIVTIIVLDKAFGRISGVYWRTMPGCEHMTEDEALVSQLLMGVNLSLALVSQLLMGVNLSLALVSQLLMGVNLSLALVSHAVTDGGKPLPGPGQPVTDGGKPLPG